jgi:integrase
MNSTRSARERAKFHLRDKFTPGIPRAVARAQRQITSFGTHRNYLQAMTTFTHWLDAQQMKMRRVTVADATKYLQERATRVTQKTLDLDRQALQVALQVDIPYLMSTVPAVKHSRAYSVDEVQQICKHQTARNAFATQVAFDAGLRAHELATLAPLSERSRSEGARAWRGDLFLGRENMQIYTVGGKGGLVRLVGLRQDLALELEERRLPSLRLAIDRQIRRVPRYDIGFGQAWSQSFSDASVRALGFSMGAHGLRHAYAQTRMRTLLRLSLTFHEACQIVSQELGHFRPDITHEYLR